MVFTCLAIANNLTVQGRGLFTLKMKKVMIDNMKNLEELSKEHKTVQEAIFLMVQVSDFLANKGFGRTDHPREFEYVTNLNIIASKLAKQYGLTYESGRYYELEHGDYLEKV